MKINWSSLWRKEDWWAVWIGGVILLLGIAHWLPSTPAFAKWLNAAQSFPAGFGGSLLASIILLAFLFALTAIGMWFMKQSLRQYLPGFLVVFFLGWFCWWLGSWQVLTDYGLERVLWALIIGLIIGNIWRIPEWLKTGAQTEFYIKIGLVLLGAEILFQNVIAGGAVSMGQAILVVLAVWFLGYWIFRRFGLSETFSATMATGVSICGVSAAIAAGGAVKGEPKHVSYTISLVLLCAIPMLIGMPYLARAMGLDQTVAGAWVGGTIDTTGAVVAAGELIGEKGLQVAALVKLSQNVLIGFWAFGLAIWATLALQRKPGGERPRAIEIWYRFPKFIVGFVAASIIFSFAFIPAFGADAVNGVLASTKSYREWFFIFAFISIGLQTRVKDLLTVGGGRPALSFVLVQIFNIAWTLLIVWLLWSGIFWTSPI
jgi:uncharacterized integral membrane protein (TIGR00698 family)